MAAFVPPAKFGAVQLNSTNRGEPDLSVDFVEKGFRELEEDECLVRIAYAPINPSDINVLEGTYVIAPSSLPAVPGLEGSGVVVAIKEGQTLFDMAGAELKVGDHVVGQPWGWGSWQEFSIINCKNLRLIPSEIDLKAASMMCINPPTAYGLLMTAKEGDWVIQNAANSGMGQAIIQVAKARGIHTVCIVRRDGLNEELQELGADVVVTYSGERHEDKKRTMEEFLTAAAKVKEQIGKVKIKLAINAVCGLSGELLAKCLSPGGLHLTYGVMSQQPMSISGGQLLFKDISYQGWHLNKLKVQKDKYAEMWEWLVNAMIHGKVTESAIDTVYSLKEVKDAVKHAFSAGRSGKILFKCS